MGRAGGLKCCRTIQKIISTSLITLKSLRGPRQLSSPCVGDVTARLGASPCTPWHSRGERCGLSSAHLLQIRDSGGAAGIKHPDFSAEAAPALRGQPDCASVSLPVWESCGTFHPPRRVSPALNSCSALSELQRYIWGDFQAVPRC